MTSIRLVTLCLAAASALPAETVFLFSLDGLGHQIFTKSAIADPLRTLKQLAARGAMADGIQPAFPSTTANSHAALWTGAYGDVSNITANSQPALPRDAHTFRDRTNGYRADQLAAEPIWVAAARQGRKAVAYQATQLIPFNNWNTRPGTVAINSYQGRQIAPHQVLRRKDLQLEPGGGFSFLHGELRLRGSFANNGLRIEGVFVRRAPAETEPPRNRPLARHFSKGLYLATPVPVVIYFRLFEYSAADLLLYVSQASETAMYGGDSAALLRAAGGTIGNSFLRGGLSLEQSLETMELAARQNYLQTRWLHQRHRPDLLTGYIPFADEIEHEHLGAFERGDPNAKRALSWAFTIIERWSQEIAKLAGPEDHIVVTADHGMAPTYQWVDINEALRRAGLGDQAVHVYNSILLNTTDWKGGTVRNRDDLRRRVRDVLAALRNPDPVVAAFFTPEEHAAQFGIGGPASSDLYFDLAPGYSARDLKGQLFAKPDYPGGNHGFRPDREDMLALLFAAGPRVPKGTRWPRLKSIDVAPLVARLLGIEPPKQARGRSPLP